MPRFFVHSEAVRDGKIVITGDDAYHISRSLRMATGEPITVCDSAGREYECVLEDFSDRTVTARVEDIHASATEPDFYAHVFQGLPKGDKAETVIQKSVECGASEITLFESEFCVAKAKPDNEKSKTERRMRIAAEAAKQCGRGLLPVVHSTVSFREALQIAAETCDAILFCFEGEGTKPLGDCLIPLLKRTGESAKAKPKIAVFVGSEGGFSSREAAMAVEAGAQLCNLGRRILRTETAASFVLACLVFCTELCREVS